MTALFLSVCAFYARLKGWKFEGSIPEKIKKCVVIVAPHTSGWDFIIGMAALHHYGFKISYFAKEELFKFPLKSILRATGGIPVDRFHQHNIVDFTVKRFQQSEQMYLVLAPEGTRAYAKKWRTGFYQIVLHAHVPLMLGYLDYGRKTAGITASKPLTGDKNKDFQVLKEFYQNIIPYHRDKWCADFE